jgi:hypothetical protein
MTEEAEKQAFLARVKSEGRSSPAGWDWQEFYLLLCRYHEQGAPAKPPVPLILAASGASDDSKHTRLSEQLAWAITHSCFREAITFLERLPRDHWNAGSLDQWNRDSC